MSKVTTSSQQLGELIQTAKRTGDVSDPYHQMLLRQIREYVQFIITYSSYLS